MIREILFLATFLTVSIQGISQDDYTSNTNVVIKRINASNYSITKIRRDNKVFYSGFLKSKKPLIKSGVFSFYSSSGHLTAVGRYENDVLVGEWIYCDIKIDSTGKKIYGTPTIIDYDKVHTYMANERLVKPVPIPTFDNKPTYNGGDYRVEFKKYITENMVYPAYPKYEGIEGQVLIQFRINEKGQVREPSVVKLSHSTFSIALPSSQKDFSIEALRLIIEAPGWEPAIRNNRAINAVINWTITYKL